MVSPKNSSPDSAAIASPVGQGMCSTCVRVTPRMTEPPRPGPTTKGKLAYSPIARLKMAIMGNSHRRHRRAIHASRRQQCGNDDYQVGGGQETRQARKRLLPDGGLPQSQAELSIEPFKPSGGGPARVRHCDASDVNVDRKRGTSISRAMCTCVSPLPGAWSSLHTCACP